MSFRMEDTQENRLLSWWFQVAPDRTGLKTQAGEHLIVLDPGSRNDGPGPDIRDAVIALDGRILSGMVEMHVSPQDWFTHGHDRNVAYEDVILHVVNRKGRGPDLPTLIVRDVPQVGWCRARRPLTAGELYLAAADRYRYKRKKILAWEKCTTVDWPVARLGFLDTLALGPHREKLWWYITRKLRLPRNPTGTTWRGSFQSRNQPHRQREQIDRVIQNLVVVEEPDLAQLGWKAWEGWWRPHFRAWRIPPTLLREWLVNWVVPVTYSHISTGLKIWEALSPPRHYGLERRVSRFTGWGRVRSVLEQQGLLFWWQEGCRVRHCHICPLTRLTVREKLSNTLYDKRLANSSLVNCERIF